jgi:hypothetical protein
MDFVSKRGTVNGVIFSGVGAGAGLTPPPFAGDIAAHGGTLFLIQCGRDDCRH